MPHTLAIAGICAATWLAILVGCGDAPGRLQAPPVISLNDADPRLVELLDELHGAVRAAPRSGEMRGRLAMAYDVNGFADAALDTYRQAELLDQSEFSWPYFGALLLGKRGDLADALAAMERALANDPRYIPAWLWYGAWCLDEGRVEKAADAYENARALGAGSPAVAGLAQVQLRRQQPAAAVALLEPVNAELRHPHLYRMLGSAYRALGRHEDARIAFARGRLATPMRWRDPVLAKRANFIASFGGQITYAQQLIQAERIDDAIEVLAPWQAEYGEDAVLLGTLASAYISSGDLQRAFPVLQRGLALHPDDFHFHFHIARLYAQEGNAASAEKHLRQAIQLNPSQAVVHEELGHLLLSQGRPDEAAVAFDAAIRHGAVNSSELLHATGLIEAARGNWEAAVERFTRATEIDISLTRTYVHLARSLAETGRFADAQAALAWAERLGTHRDEVAAAAQLVEAMRAQSASVEHT